MEHQLLPPWSKKRRTMTAVVATGFILIISSCIGYGVYSSGVRSGAIQAPFTKDSVIQSLLRDRQFALAVNKSARLKICSNEVLKFSLAYTPPLRPVHTTGDEACVMFVTTHPTGASTTIKFEKKSEPKELLASQISKEFSFVDANMISGITLETSRISGVKNSIPTTVFLMKESPTTTWVVTYAPTSQILDGKVLQLVESFRLQ